MEIIGTQHRKYPFQIYFALEGNSFFLIVGLLVTCAEDLNDCNEEIMKKTKVTSKMTGRQ